MPTKLDTIRFVETPEGVELSLRAAGPMARSLAWAIDQCLRLVAYTVVGTPLAFLGDTGVGVFLIFLFCLEWFFPVFFEVWRYGSTPGKALVGLTVVHDDGTPVGLTASLVRNLLRFADFLPLGYLLGLGTMLMQRDFKRLGDLVAGTVVAYRDGVMVQSRLPQVGAEPVPLPLDIAEQRAVIEFAERSHQWSPERRLELAALAEPLAGSPPAAAASRLDGMAHWLLGQR
jgi:uncharacterized RDD family membrane protein YckC